MLPGQEHLRAELKTRYEELLADQGDAAFLRRDGIKRAAQLTIIADTLAEDLVRRGLITPKGQQRAALNAYLSVIDRLTRLSATLGLDRRTKPVTDLARQFMEHDRGA
jgi:hypothetical protein